MHAYRVAEIYNKLYLPAEFGIKKNNIKLRFIFNSQFWCRHSCRLLVMFQWRPSTGRMIVSMDRISWMAVTLTRWRDVRSCLPTSPSHRSWWATFLMRVIRSRKQLRYLAVLGKSLTFPNESINFNLNSHKHFYSVEKKKLNTFKYIQSSNI